MAVALLNEASNRKLQLILLRESGSWKKQIGTLFVLEDMQQRTIISALAAMMPHWPIKRLTMPLPS
jgi:hypothetical protein